MSEKVRVGIVGCGGISRRHLQAFQLLKEKGLANFSITAVCDVDEGRARERAEQAKGFGEHPKVFTDHEKMLSEGIVDAVDICTKHDTHHVIAIAALEAGVHAAVESAWAISVRAAKKMVEASQKAGKICAIISQARFSLPARASKWVLEQGYIGDLQILLHSQNHAAFYPDKIVAGTPWRHKKLQAGGGMVIDVGSYYFDLVRFLCGEVEEVMGLVRTLVPMRVLRNEIGQVIIQVQNEVEDVGFALLKFSNGAVGLFYEDWGGHGEAIGFQGRTSLKGTKGSIRDVEGETVITLDDGTKADAKELFRWHADEELKQRWFPKGITDGFALKLNEVFVYRLL